MLENDREKSLKQVCALAILRDEMTRTLNIIFEEYCTKIGLETIEKCATEAIKVSLTYINIQEWFLIKPTKNRTQKCTSMPYSLCTTNMIT